MKTWIKNPAAVFTGNNTGNKEKAPHGIVIEGKKIIELVTKDSPDGDFDSARDSTIDAGDCVLLPGLINCHHHFFQTLTRAFPAALNRELFDWLQSLYPVWAGLTESAIAASTETALAELLLSGCTTTTDHHYLFSRAIPNAIDVQAEVAQRFGMRVILTRGSMSLGESDGGLPPDDVVQSAEEILKDSERLILKWHNPDEGAMIRLALAPCSPFSVTAELMQASAELAREHGVLLHTHLAETADEDDFCLEKFGQRPIDYLEQLGWLKDDVWLAHGIHFNDDEVGRLGRAGVAISHCPSSNMVLASGIARLRELAQAGCPVGIGVDGSASNDSSNLMQEVRQAFLLQRLKYGAANISHEDALMWATSGGAALFRRSDIGEISVGKQADIALFDLNELRFAGAMDPIAALVLCGAHRARDVMVAGEWKVRNSELTDVDLEKVIFRQQEEAELLASRL